MSSEGEIRTDRSNTDESFVLDLNQYIDLCDDQQPDEDLLGCVTTPTERHRTVSHDITPSTNAKEAVHLSSETDQFKNVHSNEDKHEQVNEHQHQHYTPEKIRTEESNQ